MKKITILVLLSIVFIGCFPDNYQKFQEEIKLVNDTAQSNIILYKYRFGEYNDDWVYIARFKDDSSDVICVNRKFTVKSGKNTYTKTRCTVIKGTGNIDY